MESISNTIFQECKPWESEYLNNNLNLLNNLRHNLVDYEMVYKKHVNKSKCLLPKINHQKIIQPTKKLNSNNEFCHEQHVLNIQKSLNLKHSISQGKKLRKIAFIQTRCTTGCEKQDNLNSITDRKSSNNAHQVKQCSINFDQLHKYRRMQKRQLHQIVFGDKIRVKKYQQDPIYHCRD